MGSDTSNKLYVLGPVGRWYKTMAAWKVNSGSAISGVQENRPRSIVVHDPDTMAKALCCDLKWDDGGFDPSPEVPGPRERRLGRRRRERGHAVRLGRRRRERGHAVRVQVGHEQPGGLTPWSVARGRRRRGH